MADEHQREMTLEELRLHVEQKQNFCEVLGMENEMYRFLRVIWSMRQNCVFC